MNLLRGTWVASGDGVKFQSSMAEFDLPGRAYSGAEREVVAGLRPEQITVGGNTGLAEVEATVSVIDAMGPETVIWCTVGNTLMSVRVSGDFAGEVGQSVRLGLDLANASYFDQASGLLLA